MMLALSEGYNCMTDKPVGILNGNSSLTELIPAVASWASQQRLIESLHFFGSRVRGEEKPTSDLDIAIRLIHSDHNAALANWFFECDAWASQLSSLLPWKLDLQLFAPGCTPTISKAIERSSFLVYQRHSNSLVGPSGV